MFKRNKPIWHIVINRLRAIYLYVFPNKSHQHLDREESPQICSDLISSYLKSNEPCMIARYGSVELFCLTNYLSIKKGPRNVLKYITGSSDSWWWIQERLDNLKNNAGFFSNDLNSVERFCELMLKDTEDLDVLASWIPRETHIQEYLINVRRIFLPYLEPYWSNDPWTKALKGKNVLVIHPFVNQIKNQYLKRDVLFKNKDILPPFNLLTLMSVQSMGGENCGFKDWFEALSYMKSEMDKIDYDICIIGCGAYGFHLAAHAKRQGKKAIHMGGATQLLFGIKGNRWEDPMYGVREWGLPYGFYTEMFNEYWVKPGVEGRPKNAEQVEGACYW